MSQRDDVIRIAVEEALTTARAAILGTSRTGPRHDGDPWRTGRNDSLAEVAKLSQELIVQRVITKVREL